MEELIFLGDNIREKRIELNYNQLELALRADCRREMICGLENYKANPGPRRLIKIAKALDVTMAWLYTKHRKKIVKAAGL